jgi:hypothetical protein
MAINLHPVNKISFHGVYAPARTIMKYRGLPLSIHKDLKLFFHFQITPVMKKVIL